MHSAGVGSEVIANRLGVGWVREEFRWNEVERVKGRYDWTVTDRLMRSATARGLKVLPMLYLTPRHVERDILQSGWLLGEQVIAKKAAAVSVKHGEGKVVLLGFRAQNRDQTHGTFKMVFNALLNGPAGGGSTTTNTAQR